MAKLKIKRMIQKYISVGLVLAMVTTVLPSDMKKIIKKEINVSAETTLKNPRIEKDSSMNAGQKVTWDWIYFGSYPQTEILDKKENSVESTSDYKIDKETYTKLKNATGWDDNGDIVIDNKKYRRCYQSYDKEYHYFVFERIKWRVLKTEQNTAFLLSELALDNQEYNAQDSEGKEWKSSTWEESTIRSWLNGYGKDKNKLGIDYTDKNFINNAFSSEERNVIKKTDVKNKDNLDVPADGKGGNDTQDQIFLLSESEVYTNDANRFGFANGKATNDEGRMCMASAYACARGLFMIINDANQVATWWWLRSPGYSNLDAIQIRFNGDADDVMIMNKGGVRPALQISLTNSNLWTYAGTKCNDGTGTVVNPEDNNKQPNQDSSKDQTTTPSQPGTSGQPISSTTATLKEDNEIYASSKTVTYKSKPFYLNVKTKGNGELSYGSSNKKVVTIGKNGRVTPVGYGETTISIHAHETERYKEAFKNIKIFVVPKKITLKKVTSPKKNCIKVKWGKDKTVTGYQMMFSKKKNFKNSTFTRWYKQKQSAMSGMGLNSKKTYYFKIRAYKTVGKKKLYGAWSSVKKVKIK